MSRVGKCQKIKAELLPPTEDSARQHYFRVYGQVQEWRGHTIDPTEWGWRKEENQLFPTLSTKPPGPPYLLKYIKCGCKEDGCNSNNCSCKRIGLPCTLACTNCCGTTCHNKCKADEEDE